MKNLTEDELVQALVELPGWRADDGKLYREWGFSGFLEAMAFVNRVALVAEAEDHHPDIDIRYNRVILRLWTHVTGGISRRDVALARKLGC